MLLRFGADAVVAAPRGAATTAGAYSCTWILYAEVPRADSTTSLKGPVHRGLVPQYAFVRLEHQAPFTAAERAQAA